jgi:hypothetical protein
MMKSSDHSGANEHPTAEQPSRSAGTYARWPKSGSAPRPGVVPILGTGCRTCDPAPPPCDSWCRRANWGGASGFNAPFDPATGLVGEAVRRGSPSPSAERRGAGGKPTATHSGYQDDLAFVAGWGSGRS